MINKNDRWSALSMQQRADLIKLYVSNGITSLDNIKKDYNSFGDGGEKEEVNIPSDGYFRDLAYRISVNPKVSARGFAPVKTIIKELGNSNEDVSIVDDNKLTYLYGNINGLYPAENSSGKDFSTYLKRTYPIKYKKGKIKEYQGTLNPFNEYVFDERDRVLVEELAKKGKGVYSNADTEYDYMADVYDENEPYRDDVASYHMQFVNTPNGYAVSASDLYDFGPDYKASKYGDINPAQIFMSNVQGRLMGLVGNPFILRQDNVPIRFIDTINGSIEHRYGEDASRAKGLRDAIDRAMLSDKEREEGILPEEKIAQILETGYIQPSIVTSNANGGKLNKFETGGPTEEILNSNTNESLITREEYLNKQRQNIINQSIENSNNRIQPAVPYIGKYKDQNDWEFQLNYRKQFLLNLIEEATVKNWDQEHVNMYTEELKSLENEYNKGYRQESIPGATCIYTATDNYGKKYRVAGNKSFRSSPEKYGFTEINLNDIKPGDIIQDFSVSGSPTHAITFMGYNDEGTALYNYSSGDHTKEAIRKNKKYPFYTGYGDELHLNNEDNTDLRTHAAAYRFIGTQEDNDMWNNTYNQLRKNYAQNITNELKNVSSPIKGKAIQLNKTKLLTK